MKTILITGSSGLIGSEVSAFFHERGFVVQGVANNQRAIFFGPQGDTWWNQQRLQSSLKNFRHNELDIRDRQTVLDLVKQLKPDVIGHCAAQPSHDRTSVIPFEDFDTNAGDLRKMRSHYPAWDITKSLRQTTEEIVESWHRRLVA